jgi:rhamnopyranosyl-N-acetylglucosaminyl-diphospho-decaprenol beta-1,3/1,4-galactofuranosyltransferase
VVCNVCAVLVTHNRARLLREALAAVAAQSRGPDTLVVVDNASTDETADILRNEIPGAVVLRFAKNQGSSGGYHAGIRHARRLGCDWVWTLDDDTIAEPDALRNLLAAADSFPADNTPSIVASKVVWTDGSLHPMNVQKPKLYDPEAQLLAAAHGTMSIRFSSFVSMLIRADAIGRHGLPVSGYFMWNDDVEFSARILRDELGVVAPRSVVCHKTAAPHEPGTSTDGKYFYEIRNKLWLMRHSKAFNRAEKWWMARSLMRRTGRYLCHNHWSRIATGAVGRGLWNGLTARPMVDVEEPTLLPASHITSIAA